MTDLYTYQLLSEKLENIFCVISTKCNPADYCRFMLLLNILIAFKLWIGWDLTFLWSIQKCVLLIVTWHFYVQPSLCRLMYVQIFMLVIAVFCGKIITLFYMYSIKTHLQGILKRVLRIALDFLQLKSTVLNFCLPLLAVGVITQMLLRCF